MTALRKITASLTVVAVTTGLVVVAAGPASALATPILSVTVKSDAGGFEACAYGSSAPGIGAAPHWEFNVVGTTAPIINSVADDGATFYSMSFPACLIIDKLEGTAGGFTATLTLVSNGLDLANSVVGTGAWDPAEGDHTTSMRTCGEAGCFVTERTP